MERVQVTHMGAQLFYSTRTESVASSNQNAEIVFNQPEADFSQVCWFAYAIDAAKRHDVRTFLSLSFVNVAKNVNTTARWQDLHQRLGKWSLHCASQTLKCTQHLKNKFFGIIKTDKFRIQEISCFTFPSSLAQTDSQSLTAISAATFLPIKWSFIFSKMGAISSWLTVFEPTKFLFIK